MTKIQTGLRINEDMYGKLKTLSVNENRSLNNFIEFIIKSYIADYEKQNGPIPIAPFPEN